MVFQLSEESQSFQNTVRRLFEKEWGSSQSRNGLEARDAISVAFAGLQLNEIYGAREIALESLIELAIVAREIGRAVAPNSLLESILAGPLFFSSFCAESACKPLKEILGTERYQSLQKGADKIVRSPSFYHDAKTLVINEQSDRYTVTGVIRLVPYEEGLKYVLYVADQYAYLIQLDQPGKVDSAQESALDFTQPRVKITLREARVLRIEVTSWPLYLALSRILIAAEILGACHKAFEMTVEYVKTRQQFSKPIGSFQAVQHSLADIYQKIEMMDSLVSFSVWSLKGYSPQSEISSQSLLRLALREGVGIVEKAIQLHGGIGFTWEHDLHLYLRRVRTLVALAGNQASCDDNFFSAVDQLAVG